MEPEVVEEHMEDAEEDEEEDNDDEEMDSEQEDDDEQEEEEYDGDLNDDLYEVLSADYAFKGSFYHLSNELQAPNPGLYVDGIGLIGLPLSERDAQLIASRASQAPFGKGLETVVDREVRDTWEIDAARVRFLQPKWEEFMEELATKKVWGSLGVGPWTTKPRFELYKLLLYQQGSHFLPHQDTPKAPGMFATIVVVLPSLFSGGAVHLSHAGRTTVLDVSHDSLFATSVLAWYTDVVHEVKPITSGYRLALSYNLIHTSPTTPLPALTPGEVGVVDALRTTLGRWRDGLYEEAEMLYAFMLGHQYSINDLNRGMDGLKGQDAQLIAQLRPIADALGFALCLANVKKKEWGDMDPDMDDDNGWAGRRKYYEDDYPPMGDVEGSTIHASNFVRLGNDGEPIQLGLRPVELSEDALVPKNEFEDASPDGGEYEGYMGNYPGTVEQWYQRSAVIIYLKDDEPMFITQHGGSSTTLLQTLPITHTPTSGALKIVESVLATMSTQGSKRDDKTLNTVLRHALSWRRADYWTKALKLVASIEEIDKAIGNAVKVFPIETIHACLAELIQLQTTIQARLSFIATISSRLPEDTRPAWVAVNTVNALRHFSQKIPNSATATLLLNEAVKWGLVDVWNKAVVHLNLRDPAVIQPTIYNARHVFPFEAIEPGLSMVVDRGRTLADRLNMMNAIACHLSNDVRSVWVQRSSNRLIEYFAREVSDTETAKLLVNQAETWGRSDIWNAGIVRVEAVDPALESAVKVFAFGAIEPGLTKLVEQERMLQARLSMIGVVEHHLNESDRPGWVRKLTVGSLVEFGGSVSRATSSETVALLLGEATKWDQVQVWNQAVAFYTGDLEGLKDTITVALSVFAIEGLKPGLGELLKAQRTLRRQLDVIEIIQSCVGDGERDWISELNKTVLESYSQARVEDVPTLARLAKEGNVETIKSTVLPKTATVQNAYRFHLSLAEALLSREHPGGQTCTSPPSDSSPEAVDLAHDCLAIFTTMWRRLYRGVQPNTVKEVINTVVRLCLDHSYDDICFKLLEASENGYVMEVVNALRARLAAAEELADGEQAHPTPTWVGGVLVRAVGMCFMTTPSDVSSLVWVTEYLGVEAAQLVVVPRVSTFGTFDFLVGFTKALRARLLELGAAATLREDLPEIRTAWDAWTKALLKAALAKFPRRASLSDIPAFEWIVQELGPADGADAVIWKIRIGKGSYDVLLAFAKSLHNIMSSTPETPEPSGGPGKKALLKGCRRFCLKTAALQWEYDLGKTFTDSTKINRIIAFVQICCDVGDLEPCTDLFKILFRMSDLSANEAKKRYHEIHIPLVKPLKAELEKRFGQQTGQSIMLEPFRSFFKHSISIYLARILSATPAFPTITVPTQRIGCGCADCKEFDRWFRGPSNAKPYSLRAPLPRRTHIENVIVQAGLKDLVRTDTDRGRSPHTLNVACRQRTLGALKWREAQSAAAGFIRSVADDKELRELMGERYADVLAAVQGTKLPYVEGKIEFAQGLSGGAEAGRVGSASTAAGSVEEPGASGVAAGRPGPLADRRLVDVPPPVAGVKRKEPPSNVIDVIDLT